MSLALLTTFYGLFFSIVLWTPFQNKLERVFELKSQGSDHILHWLELLENQKPAQYLQELITDSKGRSSKAAPPAKG